MVAMDTGLVLALPLASNGKRGSLQTPLTAPSSWRAIHTLNAGRGLLLSQCARPNTLSVCVCVLFPISMREAPYVRGKVGQVVNQ